ncbi:hypothetical protein MLD38_030949 [Melastoma candidum]|uniref:Uncharacterized protein n=1 Tax=Melastoma candidum TaxID=119954 RepID=A0ACB9MQ56_9MYRT|nr:hypothetical protein MLD38_030949 [Melastoma candidum]
MEEGSRGFSALGNVHGVTRRFCRRIQRDKLQAKTGKTLPLKARHMLRWKSSDLEDVIRQHWTCGRQEKVGSLLLNLGTPGGHGSSVAGSEEAAAGRDVAAGGSALLSANPRGHWRRSFAAGIPWGCNHIFLLLRPSLEPSRLPPISLPGLEGDGDAVGEKQKLLVLRPEGVLLRWCGKSSVSVKERWGGDMAVALVNSSSILVRMRLN